MADITTLAGIVAYLKRLRCVSKDERNVSDKNGAYSMTRYYDGRIDALDLMIELFGGQDENLQGK